jgi:hypothetical protein
MRATAILLAVVGFTLPLAAQAPGDSVRLRLVSARPWLAGRTVSRDSSRLVLRQMTEDKIVPLLEIERLEVWKKRNVPLNVLGSTAFGAALWGVSNELDSERSPVTGSKGGDIALGAGIGALVGIVYVLVSPGSWHHLRLAGR